MQPAVSIGNVGQLVTDLLITNLNLKLVGHIHDEDVLAVAGNDAYGTTGRVVTSVDGMSRRSFALKTSCINSRIPFSTVYQATDRPLTVIQQRAPVASVSIPST